MSSPAPKSPEMSDKSKKYDRQIRLWGEHGQQILENSNICLINATALGCEILKGLVLPGIGSFTIIDESVVTEEDIGCNFFLDSSFLGLSKAQNCMQLLQELNPDVKGNCFDEGLNSLLENSPDFFNNFNVVIASGLSEKLLAALSRKLWDLNIPVIYCRSVGFIGSIRLQLKEHCVIETHPDNVHSDLRLEHPFPALKRHVESATLSSKIPWLIVLYKYLQDWCQVNGENYPKTYKQKTQLRNLIRSSMTADEENYEEAIKAVNSSFGGGKVTPNLQALFDDSACINLTKDSNIFWILLRALKEFVETENNGCLPVTGTLPDMTADTESYINLQNVYRQQAMHDSDSVFRRCQSLLKELALPLDTISQQDAKLFCREAAGIAVIRGTKIEDEYEKTDKGRVIAQELETPGSLMEFYIALRAFEKFQTEHGHIPGECRVDADTARLKTFAGKILNEWGIQNSISYDLAHELCRYGGSEIHSVSAFLGGCVAQEVIKILTKQYKPLDNTLVYNAITTETATFKL